MKVLLVEDSLTVRVYVEGLLRGSPDVELLPAARDGVTGVKLAQSLAPDVVLMDLELPVMSGLDAIRVIMSTAPCPIVVLSAELDKPGEDRTFASFDAGAVDVLAKPRSLSDLERERFGERLLRVVRVMSEARVLKRRFVQKDLTSSLPPLSQPAIVAPYDVVLIGSSTGGPLVLRALLGSIPAPFPLPILIAQHIVPGFEHGLATWLSESGHYVSVVRPGARAEPGRVLLARADKHLAVNGNELTILPAERGKPTPSVDILFESASASLGARVVALLLSGMGDDGCHGLSALRKKGALTVTQTAETCVVDGMPGAARAVGAQAKDLAPPEMAELLRKIGEAARWSGVPTPRQTTLGQT